MSSQLSLTWDDHPKTLVGVFEKLLETSSLVDCTIAAEGQYLKAHKIILSACSPYFELLFSQENEKNPIVVLKDIKFQELKAMIDFIYRGEVKVPEERLGDFVDAAESLQIKGLGSGKQQQMSPRNVGNEVSYVQRRKGRTSPVPRKRMRATGFGGATDTGDTSSRDVVNFESRSYEGPSHEIHEEAPSLCQDETRHSRSSATNSPTSLPSSVCSEIRNLESSESVSLVKSSYTVCEEETPNPDSVVVKSEPEAMAEVYIPETECYIEPKEEMAEDVVLVESEGDTNSEPASNQFLGAVPSLASAALVRQRPSASAAAPARAVTSERGAPDSSRAVLLLGDGDAPPPPARASLPAPREHRCVECSKSFPSRHELARHFRRHSGERPFLCAVCGKGFTQNGRLTLHARVHTGERPFGCEVCGKRFAERCNLKKHLRSHTGERPFVCDLCQFTTAYSGHLAVHKRKVHHTSLVCSRSQYLL